MRPSRSNLRQVLAQEVTHGCYTAPVKPQTALEQRCDEKVRKPRCTVLFGRGEKATGLFVVLSGRVSLDFGVDAALARSYGPGVVRRRLY